MKKIRANIIKGWITSIVGTILMLASLFLWFIGVMPMIWEGVVGIVLGTVLLLAPRTIEKKVSQLIGAWGSSGSTDCDVKPDNPDEDK